MDETKEQVQDISWLLYRLAQFREDIKVDWDKQGGLYKILQQNITDRLILGKRSDDTFRTESYGETHLLFKNEKECIEIPRVVLQDGHEYP